MAEMLGLRSQWKSLPLTLTFRCPKVVVERQQEHAPGFRAAESNREGEFVRLGEGWDFSDVIVRRPGEDSMIAVLCRNNAPLLRLAFKLLRGGVGVVMLGRDIGKGLVGLARKISPDGSTDVVEFLAKLTAWKEGEIALARANGKEERVNGIEDRVGCLQAVAGIGCRTVGELKVAIERLFSSERGLVTLGSIHKSKGLEWDVVVHLDPWRTTRRGEQEQNLKYVCETRTKNVLIEANLDDYLQRTYPLPSFKSKG